MKKYLCSFLIIICAVCFSNEKDWISSQIDEDLSFLAEHPMTTKELYSRFEELCSSTGGEGHYFQIRNRKVLCLKKTTNACNIRGGYLLRYLQQLNRKYAIPDTDVVILTHDSSQTQAIPVFAYAKPETSKNVILIPDFEMCAESLGESKNQLVEAKKFCKNFPWKRKYDVGFFRGASTGLFYGDRPPDFGNDRARLIFFSHLHPNLVDATFSKLCQLSPTDMKIASSWLTSINKKIDPRSIQDHYKFKYLLDVDGNSCTYSRCRWIMLSNSVLVKVMSDHVQWYYKALEPWVHFVPVQRDLSDLADNLNYLKNHDEIAFQIACKGQELGAHIFSSTMVDLYMVSLLRKYANYVKVSN